MWVHRFVYLTVLFTRSSSHLWRAWYKRVKGRNRWFITCRKKDTRLSMLSKALSTNQRSLTHSTHTHTHTRVLLYSMVMMVHACAVVCVRIVGTFLQVNDFEFMDIHTHARGRFVCMDVVYIHIYICWVPFNPACSKKEQRPMSVYPKITNTHTIIYKYTITRRLRAIDFGSQLSFF